MNQTRTPNRRRRLKNARALAVRLLPPGGDVDALTDAVADHRGRPIRLLASELDEDEGSGWWAATGTADYIGYRAGSSEAERTIIVCHELAHMLLHHQPARIESRAAALGPVVAPHISPEVVRAILGRHGYQHQDEADAEILGTQLVTELDRQAEQRSLSGDTVSDRLR